MSESSKRDQPKRQRGWFASMRSFYVRQIISVVWMLVAVGAGLSLREMFPWLKANVDFPLMALLSGIVGIIIPNVTQFVRAGRVITQCEDRRVNLLVGVGFVILLLLALNGFITGSLL